MKARKMIIGIGLMLVAGTFTACSNADTAEEDKLYGIEKEEVQNEDSRVFDIEVEKADFEAIEKEEVQNEDS